MSKAKWAKLGLLAATSLLAVGSLTACGEKKADGPVKVKEEDLVPFGKYDDEVTISIGRGEFNTDNLPKGDTKEDNPSTRWLKQETNIKVKIDWDVKEFNDKFALVLSSGEIPDMMVVGPDQMQQLIDNDLIYDLTEIYDKCGSDQLKARYESYDNKGVAAGTRDGKIWGLPQCSPYYEQTITWIRKDWLDKVGLPVPETIDELGTAMQAFVDKKLGGDNTVGLSVRPEIGGGYGGQFDMNPIAHQYGAFVQDWINKDGEAAYGSVQPEMKDFLELMAKWYKSGIVDQEFATRDWDGRVALVQGQQMGTYLAPWWANDQVPNYKEDPNANWVAIQGPVKNKGDKFQTTKPKPASGFLVVSKKCKHPEAAVRVLNNQVEFFYPSETAVPSDHKTKVEDFKAEEAKKAGMDYLQQGWWQGAISINTEPSDNSKARGEAIAAALKAKSSDSLIDHPEWVIDYDKVLLWENEKDAENGVNAYLNYVEGLPNSSIMDKLELHDLAFFGTTKTMALKWGNLIKKEQECFFKIIMGQADISAFDDFVKEWKEQGGDEITKEVNESIKAGIIE